VTDAVEKVDGMPPARNNRIAGDHFLNRSCVFGGRLESMLLGEPLKILFQQHRPQGDMLHPSSAEQVAVLSAPPFIPNRCNLWVAMVQHACAGRN
jgi:hypothetical protein